MRHRLVFSSLPLVALFLALPPAALASNTWYGDGVNGSDNNDCKSPQTACKTIGHAISLASSGDSIMVAAATYTENLNIGISLNIVGSSASTTIIDGGGAGTVVTISNANAHVTLAKVTVMKGSGGGIYNTGLLTINTVTVTANSVNSGNLSPAAGGGINNSGMLTINNSTLSGNSTSTIGCSTYCSGYGGGIYNGGTLMINDSTLSGNTASSTACQSPRCKAYGGGIFNAMTLTINNSTLSGNKTSCGADCLSHGSGVSTTLGG